MELAAFVLHGDYDASGNMCNADSRVGGVDGLAAVAARTVDVNAKIFVFDFDVGFLGFRDNGNSSRGSMDATLTFGDRDALDAVNATFEFELAVGLVARNTKDNFFVAAGVVGGFGLEFGFEIMSFGVTQIHAVEFGSEYGSLVAAGASTDFYDSGLFVVGIFGGKFLGKSSVDVLELGL